MIFFIFLFFGAVGVIVLNPCLEWIDFRINLWLSQKKVSSQKIILGVKWILGWAMLSIGLYLVFPNPAIPICFLGLGFFLFRVYQNEVRIKKNNRRRRVFPDFLSILALGLNSGMGFTDVFRMAAQTLPDKEFQSELNGWKSRNEAGETWPRILRDWATEIQDDGISNALGLIRWGLISGAPLGGVLESQSGMIRTQNNLAMEKQIQLARLKLLFPIVIFILPAAFLILFASFFLQYWRSGPFI